MIKIVTDMMKDFFLLFRGKTPLTKKNPLNSRNKIKKNKQ